MNGKVLSVLMVIVALAACTPDPWYWSAPELFGEGTASLLNVYPPIGVVDSQLGRWLVFGWDDGPGYSCLLWQVDGEPVGNYDERGKPINQPVTCHLVPRPGQGKFTGWIHFRGHERAFCGAARPNAIPDGCRLR